MRSDLAATLTIAKLKSRGWTNGLINRFLPTPDETRPNPRFRTVGNPMKLYNAERVERIEASGEFQAAKQKTIARQAAAERAAETKRDAMDDYLSNLTIDIPLMEKETLIQAARANFRSLGYQEAYPSDERICVNYLRHCESKYEKELSKLKGKIGAQDAYFEIKQKVLDQIEFTYDWLAEECRRQLEQLKKTAKNELGSA